MTSSNDNGSRAARVAPLRAAQANESVSAAADGTSNSQRDSEHDSERRLRIATAAYYRAKARSFISGLELDDWFAAEAQIDADAAGRDEDTQIEGVGGGMDEQPVASVTGSGSISATRSNGNPAAGAKRKTDTGGSR